MPKMACRVAPRVPDARQAQHVFHGEQQRECPFEDIEQRVKALHRLHAIEDHHCHAGEDQQDQQEIGVPPANLHELTI
jgi:hypothetical protein